MSQRLDTVSDPLENMLPDLANDSLSDYQASSGPYSGSGPSLYFYQSSPILLFLGLALIVLSNRGY